MIPTTHKTKLSGRLSYPVGAKEVNDVLAACPRIAELSMRFSDLPVYPGAAFRKTLSERMPYRIFAITFYPGLKAGYFSRVIPREWKITVYPVVRSKRHVAHQLLIEEGLPSVAAWLHSTTAVGWDLQAHSLELIFDPTNESLSLDEHSRIC